MSEEFMKVCKSFRRCVDTITEKIAVILCKFTVLCLSSSYVYFLKLKLTLFYKRVPYSTRIWLSTGLIYAKAIFVEEQQEYFFYPLVER